MEKLLIEVVSNLCFIFGLLTGTLFPVPILERQNMLVHFMVSNHFNTLRLIKEIEFHYSWNEWGCELFGISQKPWSRIWQF